MAFGRTSTRDDRSAGTIPWRPNEQTSRLTASLAVRLQRVYPRPFNFFLDKRGDPPDFINETRFYRIPPETPYKRIQVLEGRNPQQAIFFFPDHSTRKKARLGENKSTSWSLGPWISPFLFFFPFLLISAFIPHSVSLGSPGRPSFPCSENFSRHSLQHPPRPFNVNWKSHYFQVMDILYYQTRSMLTSTRMINWSTNARDMQ